MQLCEPAMQMRGGPEVANPESCPETSSAHKPDFSITIGQSYQTRLWTRSFTDVHKKFLTNNLIIARIILLRSQVKKSSCVRGRALS